VTALRFAGCLAVAGAVAAPRPTVASAGPAAGLAILRADAPAVRQRPGWEAGVLLAASEGQGFWHLVYGRARKDGLNARLAQARLEFFLSRRSAARLYLGPAVHLAWLDGAGGDRPSWGWGAQAGALFNLFRLASDACLPCVFAPGGAACLACRRAQSLAAQGRLAAAPSAPTGVHVGLEAGWLVSPDPLAGLALRAFLALLY
jgi:hypothetical protein